MWSVKRLDTGSSCEATCDVMPEKDRKNLSDKLTNFSTHAQPSVRILETTNYLLQDGLDYEAYLMLRNWADEYPDLQIVKELLVRLAQ